MKDLITDNSGLTAKRKEFNRVRGRLIISIMLLLIVTAAVLILLLI